jgi:hypothetical protein
MPTPNEQDKKLVDDIRDNSPAGGYPENGWEFDLALGDAWSRVAAYRESIIASEREAAADRAEAWGRSTGWINPNQAGDSEVAASLRAAILDGQSTGYKEAPGIDPDAYRAAIARAEAAEKTADIANESARMAQDRVQRLIDATPLQEARDRGERIEKALDSLLTMIEKAEHKEIFGEEHFGSDEQITINGDSYSLITAKARAALAAEGKA